VRKRKRNQRKYKAKEKSIADGKKNAEKIILDRFECGLGTKRSCYLRQF